MIFPSNNISEHLSNLGLCQSDTVMIHGDAGVAAQYIFGTSSDPTSAFISHLLDYFNKGTVIVPTFTYSTTRGEVFAPEITPSNVGQFSEKFRLMKGALRSRHPIFSVSCVGKHAQYFVDSVITDCFGEGTFFDKLYRNNVKILTLGCSLDRVTFVHFVEQSLNVPYRYFKHFKGSIEENATAEDVNVRYFVRRLDLDTNLDLSDLEEEAMRLKTLIKKPFGRFPARLIFSKDFFEVSAALIQRNEYALIQEGKS